VSASKGKKYEREVCTRLRNQGFKAERIRGSGGGTGTRSADILFINDDHWPDVPHANETRGDNDQGLTIERAVESERVNTDFVFDGEVKFNKSRFSRIYENQWMRGHLTICPWQGRVLSCGFDSFDKPSKLVDSDVWQWFSQKDFAEELPTLTKATKQDLNPSGTAKPPDFMFARRYKSDLGPVDWVVLWRVANE